MQNPYLDRIISPNGLIYLPYTTFIVCLLNKGNRNLKSISLSEVKAKAKSSKLNAFQPNVLYQNRAH